MQSIRPARFIPRSRATHDPVARAGLPSSVRSSNPLNETVGDMYRRETYDDRSYSDLDVVSMSSASASSSRDGSNRSTPRTSLDSEEFHAKQLGPDMNDHAIGETGQEGGSWFWSKMNNLTVSVSKAWSAEPEVMDGEATPAGEDSRLTKAMKSYHLAKASHPSELPEWLFSEQERFPGRSRPTAEQVICEEPTEMVAPTPQQATRGRSLYENTPLDSRARVIRSHTFDEEATAPSRTTNRLRAMRDAKRQASGFPAIREHSSFA